MSEQPQQDEVLERVSAIGQALGHQAEAIGEMRQDIRRATEWMTALTFDDQGTFAPGETPPILSLLASIQDESRTIRIQNEAIIAQNALLIGEPTNEEAAAYQKAQARGGVSLPALLKTMRDVRWDVRLVEAGLVAVLILLVVHHGYLMARINAALSWLF